MESKLTVHIVSLVHIWDIPDLFQVFQNYPAMRQAKVAHFKRFLLFNDSLFQAGLKHYHLIQQQGNLLMLLIN